MMLWMKLFLEVQGYKVKVNHLYQDKTRAKYYWKKNGVQASKQDI